MRCHELSNEDWAVIAQPLPNKVRSVARIVDRRVINGILGQFRTGAPWGDVQARYGPHTTLRTSRADGASFRPTPMAGTTDCMMPRPGGPVTAALCWPHDHSTGARYPMFWRALTLPFRLEGGGGNSASTCQLQSRSIPEHPARRMR